VPSGIELGPVTRALVIATQPKDKLAAEDALAHSSPRAPSSRRAARGEQPPQTRGSPGSKSKLTWHITHRRRSVLGPRPSGRATRAPLLEPRPRVGGPLTRRPRGLFGRPRSRHTPCGQPRYSGIPPETDRRRLRRYAAPFQPRRRRPGRTVFPPLSSPDAWKANALAHPMVRVAHRMAGPTPAEGSVRPYGLTETSPLVPSIVIAHRLSTVRDAHRIVVIDDGRVVDDR